MSRKILNEASRNELLAITRKELDLRSKKSREANPAGPYSNRLERSAGYKGFSISDIDTSNILTNNALVVHLQVGDYDDVVELEDILYWVQISAENTNSYTKNQINTKVVTQAMMNSIDGMDIKLDCTCKDWQYRFAYQATILGYKYGEKEGRPNEDARANPENRGGVCFTGDTLICTETGYKPIKDIKVGDKVFTHKGRLQPVTEIMTRKVDKIIKTHIGTQDIYCTDNHPFYITNARHNNFRFEPITNLSLKNVFVCKPFFKLDDNNSDIDDIYAFMLGLYLADGNISERPYRDNQLTNLEIAIDLKLYSEYEKLLNQFGIDFKLKKPKVNTNSGCLCIHNSKLRDFCDKYGSHTYKDISQKCIDNEVLTWSKSAKIALIKGFFLGDGQFGSNSKYLNVRLLNTNKDIIEKLNIILRSLNIPTKCFKFSRQPRKIIGNINVSNAKDMYCITITGNYTELFTDMKKFKGTKSSSYPISNYQCAIKKYDDTFYQFSSIKSIETLPYDDIVYNIGVLNDESYLVTYDNIAVHNCKHLTAVLSNKRWLQQVTSTFMNWLEQNIEGVNKYLGLKGDKVLTLPNELARQNAKLRWQRKDDSTDDNSNTETPENNVENQEDIKNNVQGNNPSTNSYNGINNQDIDTNNDENNNV